MNFSSLILLLVFVAMGRFAMAADDSSQARGDVGGEIVERAPSSLTGARNGVSRKHYPGGADEDDLQVQATLPIPTRIFDGAAANAAVESGATESEAPAATD
jgi:hypothetical protein